MGVGRTVLGKDAPRGQEMCDHYMGPLSSSTAALACMKEVQRQCYVLGIPLKTRHREVAPNQFEFAPLFGTVTTQIDQNLIAMQILEEVAAQHGLAALLQEKPFNNVNGSGKHNNWSVWTKDNVNLLNPAQLAKASGSSDIFAVVMSALVSAVDKHGDLLRMAIANPGNDFRLGACEAPPAIVSTYLGESMTQYLEGIKNGSGAPYKPGSREQNLGTSCLPPLAMPSEDRNRTSPFPYGGHRFEFRAVGSAQNVSLVNTVLNTITADAFKTFADAIENGKKNGDGLQAAADITKDALDKHWNVIFNGNNYDENEQRKLTKDGVWRIDSGVDAMCRYTDPKNTELFSSMKVLSAQECEARQTVNLEHYTGVVEMEALCLIDMMNQHVIPAVKACGVGNLADLQKAVDQVQNGLHGIHAANNSKTKAQLARTLRLQTMVDVRAICDAAEAVVPAANWTLAPYKDLLFLDQTTK